MGAVAARQQDVDAGAAHRGAVVLDGDRDVAGDVRLAQDVREARVVVGPAAAVGGQGAGLADEGVLDARREVVARDVVGEDGLGVLVDDQWGDRTNRGPRVLLKFRSMERKTVFGADGPEFRDFPGERGGGAVLIEARSAFE